MSKSTTTKPTTKPSEEVLAKARGVQAELARRHPWLFISKWVRTQDEHDRENPILKPFPKKLMYRAIVRVWEECPVFWIEKSRQLMITWLFCALLLHEALFIKGRREFAQSQTQPKGNALISRMKMIYYGLQKLKFPGLPAAKAIGAKTGTDSKLEFPDNFSEIEAIPEGGDMIRSYTPSVVFSDENAFQPQAASAHAASIPAIAGGGRFVAVSTSNYETFMWKRMYAIDPLTNKPKGPDQIDSNRFQKKYTPEQLMAMTEEEFKAVPLPELFACIPGMRYRVNFDGQHVVTVHYTADPDKRPTHEEGRRWIAQMRTMFATEEDWEREMEIKYFRTGENRVITNWRRDLFVREDAEYRQRETIHLSFDFGARVCVCLFAHKWTHPKYNLPIITIFDEVVKRNSNTIDLADEVLERMGLFYETELRNRNYRAVGDPRGDQRRETTSDRSMNTSIKILQAKGIPFSSKRFGVPESVKFVQAVFTRLTPEGDALVRVHPRCFYIIDCLAGGWHFPEGGPYTHPEKDEEYEHGGDATRYLFANLLKPREFGLDDQMRQYEVDRSEPIYQKTTGRIIGWRRVRG